ncbi:carbohydrate ABC transporter permease [Microlunatus soli]|uniref:Carbohydrate ABC transporter membrane protein 2, CUT1 family n=1 Tax=Microlunatus soli TaxID=630515 RepID=A0A1H1YK81_9ACTN|nr:carbohydrate ABC transporter permease [Microlunatus soli]SDT21689.1 carbohydrate ABC transporter membrane protein 2, CUT1 family [Microlunatus soli]
MTTQALSRRPGRPRSLRQAPPWPVRIGKGVVLAIACLLVIFPFIGVLATSIAPAEQISASGGLVLWPRAVTLTAYESIFAGGVVTRALIVSVLVTVVGTVLSLTVSCLLAYALSRRQFVAGRPILIIVLVSMLFSPGIIPTYLVVKQAGLLDSLWALIIPTMVNAFNVVVLRAFFTGVPAEITESARVDGAGELQIFGRIMLPLSKAVLAVVGLFYAVGYWNAFFNALLYLNDSRLWPLQLVLRTYVVNDTALGSAELATEQLPPQPAIRMAILVISIVPILIVYPLLQRHFAKGVLTGAVKG